MEDLERLGVISRVTTELRNHWSVEDKDLAEYVVHLGQASRSVEEFLEVLQDNGADVSISLGDTLFRLISKLKPSGKKKEGEEGQPFSQSLYAYTDEGRRDAQKTDKQRRFPGLCMPNNPNRSELQIERPDEHAELSQRAQRLLDAEKDERELEKERKEAAKKGGSLSRNVNSEHDDVNTGSYKFGSMKVQPLKQYGIYEGSVSRVMEFGAFVAITTAEGKRDGLVHASDISRSGRVLKVGEVLKRHQQVLVKVLAISGSKLSLSMRAVDQATGEDLQEKMKQGEAFSNPFKPIGKTERNSIGEITGIPLQTSVLTNETHSTRKRKQLTDLQKFEAQQLRASGVLPQEEYLEYDEDTKLMPQTELDVIADIEVMDIEPQFLKGQTTKTGAQLSPIRIVANPDGTLARAAATSSALAKERKEIRNEQESTLLDSIPKDMSRPWEDPNPEAGERTIAAAFKGLGQNAYEVPEWKKMFIEKSVSYGQRSNLTIIEQRESLPIMKLRNKLLSAIKDNQVLVVIGETGSGKTTQIPQYLAEAGYTNNGMIGCTQPRRVAAMSVAKRVAEEYGCRLGQEVGYAMRFEDCTTADTLIKYMTDGLLLREALMDDKLSRYGVIMLDEAHERTISTDVLFGLVKACVKARPEFKLIVTSATLDAEKFSSYFFDSHIFTIPGRTFPVEILYTKDPEHDYVEAALMAVLQIHLCEPPGDILVFLTGQDEIDTACQTLHERMQKLEHMSPPPLIILPVYSALPSEMQSMIFEPAMPGCRKCVVATNIAEASLTIDGIFFVIDPGFAKMKMYNPKTGMDSLVVSPISQANAKQRAGRAGRTGPGKCFRLYTEPAFKNEMLSTAVPEIQRTNLSNTVLLLKAMGINDMFNFDFMDPPPVQSLINSLETLYELGALDDEGLLTRLGRKMAEFPMDPNLSKMLLASVDLRCSDEVISITSMMSVQSIFYRPRDKLALADQKKAKFHQPEGDLVTYLEVYRQWSNSRFSNPWCFENFLQSRALRRAQEVRKQLITIMDRYKLEIVSAGKDYNRIRKAICAGYFRHACKRDPTEGYRVVLDHQQVYVHPSSAIYYTSPEWIIYFEMVLTTKEYIRDCTTIEPAWLVDLAPKLFKKADSLRPSKRKQREKIEPLYNRFEEPNSWRLSKRRL